MTDQCARERCQRREKVDGRRDDAADRPARHGEPLRVGFASRLEQQSGRRVAGKSDSVAQPRIKHALFERVERVRPKRSESPATPRAARDRRRCSSCAKRVSRPLVPSQAQDALKSARARDLDRAVRIFDRTLAASAAALAARLFVSLARLHAIGFVAPPRPSSCPGLSTAALRLAFRSVRPHIEATRRAPSLRLLASRERQAARVGQVSFYHQA